MKYRRRLQRLQRQLIRRDFPPFVVHLEDESGAIVQTITTALRFA